MKTSFARRRAFAVSLLVAGAALVAGCAGDQERASSEGATSPTASLEMPAVENRADSVAMRLYEAMGGPEVWMQLPYLRFDFAVERGAGDSARVVARHLWNRRTGAYRLEWNPGGDTARHVALFNAAGASDSLQGEVYRSGAAVEPARRDTLLQEAYARHINDAYWLLAPVKLFDRGVNRAYAADSSTAETDVLRITFGDVGLTPGDRYWLYVGKETGRLDHWAFHLEGMDSTAAPRVFNWTEYQAIDSPAGRAVVSMRKESAGGAGAAILTNAVEMPVEVADSLFETAQPLLHQKSGDRRVDEAQQ